MTMYRIVDVPNNGTTGQDCICTLQDLPDRLRRAIEANPTAGEWRLPALSNGDSGDELPNSLIAVVAVVETPADLGRKIGLAIAKDVRAEHMPWGWTGLDAQDADILLGAGLMPDTPEWEEAESVALATYSSALHDYIASNPDRQ